MLQMGEIWCIFIHCQGFAQKFWRLRQAKTVADPRAAETEGAHTKGGASQGAQSTEWGPCTEGPNYRGPTQEGGLHGGQEKGELTFYFCFWNRGPGLPEQAGGGVLNERSKTLRPVECATAVWGSMRGLLSRVRYRLGRRRSTPRDGAARDVGSMYSQATTSRCCSGVGR